MRDYGTIDSSVWKHPDFKKLPDSAKTLFAYLKTCDHGNIIGCFHIPLEYIHGDLKWSPEKTKKTLSLLLPNRFVMYCEATEYALVTKQIEKLPFQNENQAKAAIKVFSDIPKSFEHIHQIAEILIKSWDWDDNISDTKQLYKPLINRLKTVTERSGVQFPTQEQEQELQQEKEIKDSPESFNDSEPIISIPLIDRDGQFGITEEMINGWQKDYPGINVHKCLIDIKNWNIAQKKRRKTKAGILKHITTWLGKEQDRAPASSTINTNTQKPNKIDDAITAFQENENHG